MQNPSYKTFFHKLDTWFDPEDIFINLFKNEHYAFWLDSSKFDPKISRFSYMGDTKEPRSKRIRYSATDKTLYITEKGKTKRVKKDIFEYLEEQLKMSNTTNVHPPAGAPISNEERIGHLKFEIRNLKFLGGFIGYFGYEALGNTKYKSKLPDACFFFTDRVIVFDHLDKKMYLICISEDEGKANEWFREIKMKLQTREGWHRVPGRVPFRGKITFKLTRNYQQYLDDIETCKKFLKKGESYQICLTNSFSTKVQIGWLHLYLILRKMNPAPYSAYMRFGDFAVLSSSPEKFLTVTPGGFIETKPIKGTLPRGKTKEEDKQFVKKLVTDKKERSENAMIVDLLRNDLGKVCEFGSIKVKKFLGVETYQTVHQLVSTIQGKLRNNKSVIDCIRACFPGGSMTGVPKIRTMEILSSLEKQPRGIYSGALGFFSLHGAAELSIVIRTIVATRQQLTIGSGGAVLIDSDSEKEYDEMLLKARVLMDAVAKAAGAKEYIISGDRNKQKSEALNPKFETISNNKNSNDRNELF